MKIVIVDDDKLVAVSLKTILEADSRIQVLAIGHDGKEAIALYQQYQPDVLLMDIRMECMTGLAAAEEILTCYHDARILFLTTFADDEYIIKALRIGAKGYILKQDFEGIAPALEAVHKGQTVFDGKIVDKLPDLMKGESFDYDKAGITKKEYEIIELIARGFSNKEISEKTFLSDGTIRNYLSNILNKLELRDRTQLAVFYYNSDFAKGRVLPHGKGDI